MMDKCVSWCFQGLFSGFSILFPCSSCILVRSVDYCIASHSSVFTLHSAFPYLLESGRYHLLGTRRSKQDTTHHRPHTRPHTTHHPHQAVQTIHSNAKAMTIHTTSKQCFGLRQFPSPESPSPAPYPTPTHYHHPSTSIHPTFWYISHLSSSCS